MSNNADEELRREYGRLRKAREQATFSLMRKMEPSALDCIRKEFFAREDSVGLDEFIYLFEKHLLSGKSNNKSNTEQHIVPANVESKREFIGIMYELFKDVDVNGDGGMDWEEFTTFMVEKANLLSKKTELEGIAHYYDACHTLDDDALVRQKNEYGRLVPLPNLNNLAVTEDHSQNVHIFNMRSGQRVQTFQTESFPVGIVYMQNRNLIAVSGSNSSISLYTVDDPVPSKRFNMQQTWQCASVQMCLAWMSTNEVLYSGGNDGHIYAWDLKDGNQTRNNGTPVLISVMRGHTDIVMSLLALEGVDQLVSASLDTTLCMWDTYTHEMTTHLKGHKKGVFSMSYHPSFRLLISSGFEHDAYVWSPFVKALVYKLKGHHASLIGVQFVEGSNEIITADTDGLFKLWDIRSFKCLQTFGSEMTNMRSSKDSFALNAFFHTKLPPSKEIQKEDDSRIFACSKMVIALDQERIIHDAITDSKTVNFVEFNPETQIFLSVSESNLIIWDALLGSRTMNHNKIADGADITACCLDNRRRKIVIGTVNGTIDVYNPQNGELMKSCPNDVGHAVVSLVYDAENRRFVAGYANGLLRLYDENGLEDCPVIRTFDEYHNHPELLTAQFCPADDCVATCGSSSELIKLWDYASGKMEMEINGCDDDEHFVDLIFLLPHAIIASADSRGNVILWGSRGRRNQFGYRVAGFLNQCPEAAVRETFWHIHNPSERPAGRIFAYKDGLEEKYKNPNESSSSRTNSPKKTDSAATTTTTATTTTAAPGQLATDEVIETKENEENYVQQPPVKDTTATIPDKADIINTTNDRPNTAATDISTGSELVRRAEYESRLNEIQQQALMDEDTAAVKWGRSLAATTLCFHADTSTIYTADEMGNIKKWDASEFLVKMDNIEARYKAEYNGDEIPDVHILPPRHVNSALLPITNRFEDGVYHVNKDSDYSNCNVGIDFVWSLSAHNQRITALVTSEHGIISSGDELLVKMWDFDGNQIGVFLQSVPIGKRSPQWHLDLDIANIMDRENAELDMIMGEIQELEEDNEQPNIFAMDFSGLKPGSKESAQFSMSELRQRVEKSKELLGIDFPVGNNAKDDTSEEDRTVGHGPEVNNNNGISPTKSINSPSKSVNMSTIKKDKMREEKNENVSKASMTSSKKAEKIVDKELSKYFRELKEDQKDELRRPLAKSEALTRLTTRNPLKETDRADLLHKAATDLKSFQALTTVLEKKNIADDTSVNRLEALRKARQDKVYRLSGCKLNDDGNTLAAATATGTTSTLGAAGKSVINNKIIN